jgi:hypothetical protein
MDSKIKTIINGRHRGCHLAVAGVRCPGLVARRTRSVARARTGSEPPSVSRRTDKGPLCQLPPNGSPAAFIGTTDEGGFLLAPVEWWDVQFRRLVEAHLADRKDRLGLQWREIGVHVAGYLPR